jgi:xylulokinase
LPPVVAVVDIGTSAVRAHLVASDGTIVAGASRPASPMLGTDTTEVDPDEIWTLACSALREALASVDARRVAAVGVASALGYVLLGREGTPLGRGLLYMDRRARVEARELAERVTPERLYALSGRRVDPELLAPKLAWVRRHEPDRWSKLGTFVGLKDDVVRRLTGTIASDPTHAAYSMLYDVERREWSDELLDASAIPRALLPPLQRADDIVGRVHPAASTATGLLAGTPVITGTSDGTAACLAARGGTVVNVTGSTDVVLAATDRPLRDPRQRTIVNVHPLGHGWVVGGVMGTTGAALRWLVDLAYADVAEARRYEAVEAEADAAGIGAAGLVCLSNLTGERAPRWNPAARGVVFGLDLRHRRGHIARAILESVAVQLADVLDAVRGLGLDVERVRVVGGGALSDLWNQIRADVTGIPVERPDNVEGTVTGIAFLAMRAIGLVARDASADVLTTVEREWRPDGARRARYRRVIGVSDQLSVASRPLFDTLADLRHDATPGSR